MNSIRYIPWAGNDLGISFTMSKGRISIFKKTLEALHFPEHYHFLFNTSEKTFAIQVCGMNDEGAHRSIVNWGEKFRCEVYCIDLVRFVFQTCEWEDKYLYRVLGTPRTEQQLIMFDLKTALRVCDFPSQSRQIGSGKIVLGKFPVRGVDSNC